MPSLPSLDRADWLSYTAPPLGSSDQATSIWPTIRMLTLIVLGDSFTKVSFAIGEASDSFNGDGLDLHETDVTRGGGDTLGIHVDRRRFET